MYNNQELQSIIDKHSDEWKDRLNRIDKGNSDLKKMEGIMKSLAIPSIKYNICETTDSFLFWNGKHVFYCCLNFKKKVIECSIEIREKVYKLLPKFLEYCMNPEVKDAQ